MYISPQETATYKGFKSHYRICWESKFVISTNLTNKMERLLSYVCLFLIHSCASRGHDFPGRILRKDMLKNDSLPDKLRYIERIKQRIMDSIGGVLVSPYPEFRPQTNEDNIGEEPKPAQFKLFQVTEIYSELSDKHMNDSILQFRFQTDNDGKQVEVDKVRLFIRIKMKKNKNGRKLKQNNENLTKDEKLSRKKRRKKQMKEIKIVVYNVTPDGAVGAEVASVKTKIRKTKLLRVTLPKDEIQKVIDSNNKTVQYYVNCLTCDKSARIITSVKKIKRAKRNKSEKRQLSKRRPYILLQSHIIVGT
ncbi:hypothetical protein ACF0H5_018576 [Mactra antiquata]